MSAFGGPLMGPRLRSVWVPRLDFSGDRQHKAEEVMHHIKSLIGISCKVVVKAPGDVPRSQGKAVRVKDERKKGS